MDHNCVRNPDTGACYVCNLAMRQTFGILAGLDAILDATAHPQTAPATPARLCACGVPVKLSDTQCTDCWIRDQTKQPAPKPKKIVQTNAIPVVITLDSILSAMESSSDKWN